MNTLTDLAIRAAKPASKALKLFDGGGLYLFVPPEGGRLWRLKYRFDGAEKLMALGKFPEFSLKQARSARDAARRLLADGIDPAAAKKAEKAAKRVEALNTLEAVARAWLTHRTPAWKVGTLVAIQSSLENDVFPVLGPKPISDISSAEIRDAVQAIEARGASETARRVFQRLQSVFRFAVANDVVKVDPTYPLKPSEIFRPYKVRHRASISEKDAPEFLRRLDGYGGSDATKTALRLLILTATRPGELRGACWEEIDEVNAVWRIPAARMKMGTEHIVPLSKQALALIREWHDASATNRYVFPSPFYADRPISDGTLNSALARLGYKGAATAHGFRTLFSTCANEAGWNRDAIEKQLSHEERDDVRGAYNGAIWLDERNQMMQWWANRIDDLRTGTKRARTTEKSRRRSRA